MSSSHDAATADKVVRPLTVVIDGPSGSGKTTMADEFAIKLAPNGTVSILHMEDLYAGWQGLAHGIETAEKLIAKRAAGEELTWQRYDWSLHEFTEWITIPAEHIVILEGCGSLVAQTEEIADIRIWLDAEEELRKKRAFSRGGENYEEFWDVWNAQFEQYVSTSNPQSRANLMLRSNL